MRFLALALLACLCLSAAAEDAEVARRVDAFCAPYVEAGHLSGQLLIARGDDILVERSYGLANREWKLPVTPTTRLAIASINKPITIILAARMFDEELYSPLDPIGRWIPDFPMADSLKVIDLINHLAGVPHRLGDEADECLPMSAEEMVQRVIAQGLNEEQIGSRNYSSGGYSVVARILELAGGAPYEELLQMYVLDPVGAEHTHHPHDRVVIPERAASYHWLPDGYLSTIPKDLSFLVGAGALYSTARDLHRILRGVLDGSYGETTPTYVVRGRERFGWNGVTAGYRAFVEYDATTDLSWIFLTNVQSGVGDRLRGHIPALVIGEAVDDPGPPTVLRVARSTAELDAREGMYELRPGSLLDVHREGDLLYANDWPLIPTAEGFFSIPDYGPIRWVFDDAGEPTRMDWDWAGAGRISEIARIGESER